MPNPKQPSKPRSSEEILRDMEAMSEDAEGDSSPASSSKAEGGGFKSLLNFFVKVVPEESEAPPRVTPPPASRPAPRVSELVAGEPAPKFAPPKTTATDLSQKPLTEIYREAGLIDSQCSVDELATLMENPAVANQPLSVKVIAVNLALSSKGVSHDVPIADAVRRDRALDAYQAMLAERARTAEQRNTAQIQQLTREAEEYLKRKQTEMDALRGEIAEVKRQAVDFSVRREAEEKRLASLISPFLEGQPNPVTVGNQVESPAEPRMEKKPEA